MSSAISRIANDKVDLTEGKTILGVIKPGEVVIGSGIHEFGYEVSFAGELAARYTLAGDVAEQEGINGVYLVLTEGTVIKLKAAE